MTVNDATFVVTDWWWLLQCTPVLTENAAICFVTWNRSPWNRSPCRLDPTHEFGNGFRLSDHFVTGKICSWKVNDCPLFENAIDLVGRTVNMEGGYRVYELFEACRCINQHQDALDGRPGIGFLSYLRHADTSMNIKSQSVGLLLVAIAFERSSLRLRLDKAALGSDVASRECSETKLFCLSI